MVKAGRSSPQLVLGGCHSAGRCFVKKRHVLTCGLGGRGKQSQQFSQRCSSWKRSAAPHPRVPLPVPLWSAAGLRAGSGTVPPRCRGSGEELPPARLSCSQARAETRAPRAFTGDFTSSSSLLRSRAGRKRNLPLPNKPSPSWRRGHLAKVEAQFSTLTLPGGLSAWQSPGARSLLLLFLPCPMCAAWVPSCPSLPGRGAPAQPRTATARSAAHKSPIIAY